MDMLIYVVVGIVALAAIYFLFLRKGDAAEALPPARDDKLPPKKEAAKPAAKKVEAAPEKPKAKQPVEAKADKDEDEDKGDEADAGVDVDVGEAADARPSLTPRKDISSMRKGLAKSRGEEGLFGKLRALLTGNREIDGSIAEEIEEVLLASDVGVQTTEVLLERLKTRLEKGDLTNSGKVWDALRAEATDILSVDGDAGAFRLRGAPTVVLMVGVNGAGKTTTIGKLATKLVGEGRKCVLAAGDTFRAAAVQQLVVWGDRVGCEVVKGKDGADPGSVVFDAIKKAQEIGADVVLADTAGRLHTKTNLMTEMTKIAKTAGKALEGAPHEILLVIDATTGQNALAQAKEFAETLPMTGLVLTKLDGTAKGGVVLGICDSLKLPVRFIGLGERPDDLHDFSPDAFVEALLGKEAEVDAA
ncbi:MAG TPA: signal recognition particle-docking protein FtsY [Polyangiaceae bacterium]|nr:signal recognition particle-docking protein FtsY [Polyangiaceae bacterium]HMR77783.1 signal recognition particle-docking protein FtsY [Polyangiaceae bacterium]